MKLLLENWRGFLREANEPDLDYLLDPPGETAQIGPERGRAPREGENKILRFRTVNISNFLSGYGNTVR